MKWKDEPLMLSFIVLHSSQQHVNNKFILKKDLRGKVIEDRNSFFEKPKNLQKFDLQEPT